ncbi:MAG: LemA family protein [Flavobacteriales bacterium]|nr:LemA family protein [Flavobacteriales bacterium]
MGFIVTLIIIGAPILIGILLYNNLVNRKNTVDQAESDIDVQLKKRFDLIPNLVETVKAYMKHERETLVELTELRTRAMSGGLSPEQQMEIANKVNRLGRGLMLQVENYPDLKASKNFLQLQAAWNEVEEQLSASRRTYNAAVKDYNNGLEQFPTNIMARSMGYTPREFIEIPDEERENISAKELFNS